MASKGFRCLVSDFRKQITEEEGGGANNLI